MQLVIRVDLDKTKCSLAEIFEAIGDCRWSEQANQEAEAGAAGTVRDNESHVFGEWQVEEVEDRPHPLDARYRAAAAARYVRSGEIEVDRFASVSMANHGAYVQGWLFVPRSEVQLAGPEALPPAKPPQSVIPAGRVERKAG